MAKDHNLMYLVPNKPLTNKTVVLDVDETLVHTEEEIKNLEKMGVMTYPALAGETYIISLDNGKTELWGTKRPHLDEFLLFCFTYFDKVCVWSAGQRDYVHSIVDRLFAPFRKPDIVMTFDDCVQNKDGDWIKPLDKFFNHPKAKGNIFPEDTYIIDDRTYTFEQNSDNGVLIPPYSPSNIDELRKEENNLTRLRGWFMQPQTKNVKDVRNLNKTAVFSQTPQKYRENVKRLYNLS